MQVIFFVLELLCFAVWAVFSALRVYALDNHKWRIAALTLVLGLVPVGTNTFNDSDTAIVYSYDSVFGQLCFDSPKFTSKTYTIVVSTTRTCMILSDIIVVAVTWVHTYKIKRAAKAANLQSSLADLLLRDGTFYFVILALLNAAHMSLAITGVFTFLTVFTIPISSIIISRFLLNLRQVDVSRRSADTSLPSFVRPVPSASAVLPAGPDFVTFLTGSMGESLDHSPHDEPMDDDSEDLDEDLETHVHRAAGAAPPVSSQGFTGVSAIF
ncbi:hypothetical protein OBBRIDRAFT_891399 [Obba rivulosa]|uniref:Uncharacterized protein n=1 Tax=Obba rivulosa TaxID=1052685 RepID=A0A8E2ANJ2_9APHY|nr:hypothetical protein OBBRIDRAFT_891399 [Obba rivulosa]